MRGWQATGAALIVGAVGLAQGNRIAEVIALALMASVLIALGYRLVLTGDVQTERQVPAQIVPWGDQLAQSLTLKNRARMRIPAIQVTDGATLPEHPAGYVASLGARKDITWSFRVTCRHRGRWRLGPVDVQMGDPFGIFPVRRRVGAVSSVLVLPRWVPLSRCGLKLDGFLLGEARGQRRGESPPAVTSVRPYAPGDSISAIHWRSSARSGQLVSKLFDPDVQTVLWLVLDLDGTVVPDAEELLVTATNSLALYALRQANLRVGLVASGATPIYVGADYGRGQQQHLQEVLAEAHAGTAISLSQQFGRLDRQIGPGQTVVLCTAQEPEAWHGWITRLARRGIALRVIHAADGADRAWSVPAIRLPLTLADPARQEELITLLEGSAARV